MASAVKQRAQGRDGDKDHRRLRCWWGQAGVIRGAEALVGVG